MFSEDKRPSASFQVHATLHATARTMYMEANRSTTQHNLQHKLPQVC